MKANIGLAQAPERDPDDIAAVFQEFGIVPLGAQEVQDARCELHTPCKSREARNGSHL